MKTILPSGQALYVYCLEVAIKESWGFEATLFVGRELRKSAYEQINLGMQNWFTGRFSILHVCKKKLLLNPKIY